MHDDGRLARLALSAVLLCCLLGCGAATPSARLRDHEPAASIPLTMTGPRPTAQLSVGQNAPVRVIFDTGAAASILKIDYARALGLPNEGGANAAAPGGMQVSGFRTTIAGRLGEADFSPALAVALDIPLPLPGVSGAISPAVFSGRLVKFDFPHSIARVLPRNRSTVPKGAPFDYSGGGLLHTGVSRVPTAILIFSDGTEVTVNVDSGFNGGIELPLSMAHSMRLAGSLRPGRDEHMIGASARTYIGTLAINVRIGSLRVARPNVTFVESDTIPPKVGIAILRQAVIVLDPEMHRDWVL